MFHYAVDKITERLYSMGFDDDMEVILVSQQGKLCYDSLHNFSGRASEFSGKTPTPGVYTMDGVQVVRYNNRFGFYAISTIGKHALYRSVYKMLLFVILCTFAVLALLIFLLFEYERRISRRMQELADDILKIESGRLDVVLPETKHHDEIDIFAHNLNEMQRRLADQLESEKKRSGKAAAAGAFAEGRGILRASGADQAAFPLQYAGGDPNARRHGARGRHGGDGAAAGRRDPGECQPAIDDDGRGGRQLLRKNTSSCFPTASAAS